VDQKQSQRYSMTEIEQCIHILDHMVNRNEDFVALPKDKQIELIKIAGQLLRRNEKQGRQPAFD